MTLTTLRCPVFLETDIKQNINLFLSHIGAQTEVTIKVTIPGLNITCLQTDYDGGCKEIESNSPSRNWEVIYYEGVAAIKLEQYDLAEEKLKKSWELYGGINNLQSLIDLGNTFKTIFKHTFDKTNLFNAYVCYLVVLARCYMPYDYFYDVSNKQDASLKAKIDLITYCEDKISDYVGLRDAVIAEALNGMGAIQNLNGRFLMTTVVIPMEHLKMAESYFSRAIECYEIAFHFKKDNYFLNNRTINEKILFEIKHNLARMAEKS